MLYQISLQIKKNPRSLENRGYDLTCEQRFINVRINKRMNVTPYVMQDMHGPDFIPLIIPFYVLKL
jgi:hypothetical protein